MLSCNDSRHPDWLYLETLDSLSNIRKRRPTMSEHASFFDQIAHDQRAPTKPKWRGKFFTSEGKTKKHAESSEKSDQDVDEFLRPSSSRSNSKPSLDLPVPRIDISTASRWPSVTEVTQINTLKASSPRRKPPRRVGLRVAFVSAAPDIIGVGGDEAELPAIAVSRLRGPLNHHQSLQPNSLQQGTRSVEKFKDDELQAGSSSSSFLNDDELHRPTGLQRKPTGLIDSLAGENSSGELNDPSLSKSLASIPSPNMYKQASSLLPRPRSSDGECLQPNQQMKNGEVAHLDVNPQTAQYEAQGCPIDPTNLLVPPIDLGLSLSNSLTPIPSPSPSISMLNPTILNERAQSLKTDYFQGTHAQMLEKSPRVSPRSEAESLKSLPEPRSFTIRSLAKNLGDDALRDFAFGVERFNGIFQLGAAATSPLMEIPFAQWIRTAAFWFLKGRGKLEVAVRLNGRPSAETDKVGSQDVSRDLGQAYLDLAKAWWIVEKITPSHPEPRIFGNTGMSSLMAIVTSFGEKKLAEQIGVHLAIIANMRALAMSMKRNNRLPTSSFEIQGLDTRIFVKYPVLSSGVASLCSNQSRSLVVDPSRGDESFFPILVGDTKRHFLYSTSFVDLILAASSDSREQIVIPCALSLLRERTARDLKVVIASQDGQINIVIQSSGRDGLTWEEVRWKIKTHSLTLKLSEAVEAQVQFSEKDFKTLWGIHDYTRKIQKGLQCGEGETEVFKVELSSFQNLDQENPKLFPTDSIRNCSLRLYEKKRASAEATRGIKHYDGHRLVVVTPSDTKTLSSLNLECGKQKPVLFSYLRGDGSAPALLLKIPKPSNLSMVMTFDDTKARGLFHSLLDGTSISMTETCSQPLPLKAFTTTGIQSDDFGSVRTPNFLNGVEWGQIRVINSDVQSPTHGTPRIFEHLRIWIEAEIGSFVDRMNLGKQVGSYQ